MQVSLFLRHTSHGCEPVQRIFWLGHVCQSSVDYLQHPLCCPILTAYTDHRLESPELCHDLAEGASAAATLMLLCHHHHQHLVFPGSSWAAQAMRSFPKVDQSRKKTRHFRHGPRNETRNFPASTPQSPSEGSCPKLSAPTRPVCIEF